MQSHWKKKFITTEQTSIVTKSGQKRNGNLLYTICPIQPVLDQFYASQIARMEQSVSRQNSMDNLAKALPKPKSPP